MAFEDVPIKPAATVMLLRDTATVDGNGSSIELFMLRRTPNAVFASGMYVFPGGKVDLADDEPLPGEAPDQWADTAFRVAAIRESYEEAGVLLAVDANGDFISDGHPALAHRDGVHDGSVDVRLLAAEHGLRLAVDDLAWVAHWITPKGESPRRFDTRFYVAIAPPGQTSHHDDSETIASQWVRPADALAKAETGEFVMMPPTIANLRFLAAHATAADALAAAQAIGTPACILPKIRFDASGKADGDNRSRPILGVVLPGEPGYDEME